MTSVASAVDATDTTGYSVHPGVFTDAEVDALTAQLSSVARGRAGARHLMSVPAVASVASDERLLSLARDAAARDCVPFRATLFDKSPDANWLVTWHQDTALPLRRRVSVPGWGPWSVKRGVVHAHAPSSVLETVVALQVHLDPSEATNGPLRVVPGSHRFGVLTQEQVDQAVAEGPTVECLVPRGGVVLMRPLLVHASSKATMAVPRRVLHLEYAPALSLGPTSTCTSRSRIRWYRSCFLLHQEGPMAYRAAGFLAVVLLMLALSACGGSPQITEPQPTPTPEPTPEPVPPGPTLCTLAARPDHGNCPRESPLFEAQMETALEEVIALHPEIFNMTKTRGCDRCFEVLNGHAYYQLVVDRLKRMGFCAVCDEECGVKNTNAFNEQYDIMLSNGFMRRAGSGAYRATCYPAAF